MKRILLFLVLISFAFSQQSIKGALSDSCETLRSMLPVSTMLLFILGIMLVAIWLLAFKDIKTDNKIVKTGGMILIGLGAIAFVLAIFSIISYFFVPSLISFLTGVSSDSSSCS